MMVGKAIDDVIRTIVGYYGADAQLMQFYGIPEPEVSERIDEKLKRQLERIRRNETNVKPE